MEIERANRPISAHFRRLFAALLLCLAVCTCSGPSKDARPVHVAAAASTIDLFTALIQDYQAITPADIRLNVAASSILARQIEAGAPFDIYVSANPVWMDYLQERALIDPATRADWLGNRLVLIGPLGVDIGRPISEGRDLPVEYSGRVAVADPTHVPAGIYAHQALLALKWDFGENLIPIRDVRAALAVVANGEADLGLVYQSDATASAAVGLVEVVPQRLHDPIVYPIGMAPGTGAAALEFYGYLKSERAAAIIRDYFPK